MDVTETLSEGLKREYKVVVPATDLEARVNEKLGDIAKQARMPGFRPGKVPVTLLRKTHGRRVLGEVVEETINSTTAKTLQDNEVRPAMQPKIEITGFDEGADLEYTIAVEVMPQFEPVDFATLELQKPVTEVSDAMVDERVQEMAQQVKSFADADAGQAAAEGDAVVIDFVGRIGGEAFEGGSATDFELELGSGRFIPGFEGQLVGVKQGDTPTVTVNFPEDYGNAELAGKEAAFEVTVKQVKVPLPQPVDDSLAEKFGLEDLAALKGAVKQELERQYGSLSKARLKRQLLDALADKHDFAVPPGMVDMEFTSIWEQVKVARERGEAEAENASEEEYRRIAERRVRLGLLLSEVGRRNSIQVSQEELNRAIAEQARQFPGQERMVFEHFQRSQDAVAQLHAPLLEDKVCDFILEMAQVEERPVSAEELMREPEEGEAEGGSEKGGDKRGKAEQETEGEASDAS